MIEFKLHWCVVVVNKNNLIWKIIFVQVLLAVCLTAHLALDVYADAEPGWNKVLVKKRVEDGQGKKQERFETVFKNLVRDCSLFNTRFKQK